MQRKRYYLDTSVWIGVVDRKFEFDSRMFFQMVLDNEIICLYSDIVLTELMDKYKRAQRFFWRFPSELKEELAITQEILELADRYVSEGVVGNTSLEDCQHIAAATVNEADVLVSWNFKHIVNVHRIRGYNSVNMGLGYRMLEIRSPAEVLEYDI